MSQDEHTIVPPADPESCRDHNNNDDVSGTRKRSASDAAASATKPSNASEAEDAKRVCRPSHGNILDKAVQLGLQPGDRIEVQWQLGSEEEEEDDNEEDAAVTEESDTSEPRVTFRWWPATLLPHDGRSIAVEDGSNDAVAVRVLDYDPFPEGGFPERSQESVIFVAQGILMDLKTEERMVYRRQGERLEKGDDDEDQQPVLLLQDSEMEEYVNNMMASLMEKHSDKFRKLSPAQQAAIAERLSTGKEKFLDVLTQTGKTGIVTAEKMQELLAKVVSSE